MKLLSIRKICNVSPFIPKILEIINDRYSKKYFNNKRKCSTILKRKFISKITHLNVISKGTKNHIGIDTTKMTHLATFIILSIAENYEYPKYFLE